MWPALFHDKKMSLTPLLIYLAVLLGHAHAFANTQDMAGNVYQIKVQKNQESNASQSYFWQLLQALSEHYPKSGQVEFIPVRLDDLQVDRGEVLLQRGVVDLIWKGTDERMEQDFLPVRIPVVGGLLGYRIAILPKDLENDFVNAPVGLIQNMSACQVDHWQDSNILEYNGYQLIRVSQFNFIYRLLANGRCDYFPRALFEADSQFQLARLEYGFLTLSKDLLFYYPFPSFMFVRKEDKHIQELVYQAFSKLIEQGGFYALLERHPLTRPMFPLQQWRGKRLIELSNPWLPKASLTIPEKYWIRLH